MQTFFVSDGSSVKLNDRPSTFATDPSGRATTYAPTPSDITGEHIPMRPRDLNARYTLRGKRKKKQWKYLNLMHQDLLGDV
jgi:hypothetical protein